MTDLQKESMFLREELAKAFKRGQDHTQATLDRVRQIIEDAKKALQEGDSAWAYQLLMMAPATVEEDDDDE